MVLIKSSFASVLVGAALTASASGAALPSNPRDVQVSFSTQSMYVPLTYQNVMMVPREQAVLQAPLAPAEHDIKSIVNKMGQKMMRRDQQYQGEDVDFTQQPEKRLWRGRLGRRGPLRQRQEEEQVQEAQEVSISRRFLDFTDDQVDEADWEGMRGDSLPGGSDMDFEARGLPARPHQPIQPQTQPENQEPEAEQSRSDFQQESEPAQGGKEQDVSLLLGHMGMS